MVKYTYKGGVLMTDEERRERKRESNEKYRETHKEQAKAYHKAWRDKNREHLNAQAREKYKKDPQSYKAIVDRYKETHKEQIKEANHKYKVENRQKCTDYQRNKRQGDPVYKFRSSFTHLMCLYKKKKGYSGGKGTWEIVGCDFDTFLAYVQSQFQEGMTLENYGHGKGQWNIDHIEPIRNAKDDDDFERLNHYTNLRPLWATENYSRPKRTS
jgi:hypothetical protein